MPLHARWGIPEAWLVDLAQDRMEVYRNPKLEGSREVRSLTRGERVASVAFPDLELRVGDILG